MTRNPHAPWRKALVVGALALALALLELASFGHRAATCSGHLVRADARSAVHADPLSPAATAWRIGSREDWGPDLSDTTSGTRIYQLGPFRLRSNFATGYHSRPGNEEITLEDPASCDSRPLPLFDGTSDSAATVASESATLRRGAGHDEWVVTLHAFYETPEIAFRRAPQSLPWPSAGSIAGAFFLLLGLHSLRRAAPYFHSRGRGHGLATWREGTLRDGGWIEPREGGEPVWATGTLATPGGDVLFTVAGNASPTYRTTNWPVAARVCAGSHATLQVLHARFARRAMVLLAVSCVAFAWGLW